MGIFNWIKNRKPKWEPLICKPQDIMDLCAQCIEENAPILQLWIDYNGERHLVGLSSDYNNRDDFFDTRYVIDDTEFETAEEFKEKAAIAGQRFMDMEYIKVIEDEGTGNPRWNALLKDRELKGLL